MFGNSDTLVKRLEKLECKLESVDELIQDNKRQGITVSSEIKYISQFLAEHMTREEEAMKDHTTVLQSISTKLGNIESDLHVIPKDFDLKLSGTKTEILKECFSAFAEKEDLTSGLNSIRNEAKLIWYVLGAIGGIASGVLAFYLAFR